MLPAPRPVSSAAAAHQLPAFLKPFSLPAFLRPSPPRSGRSSFAFPGSQILIRGPMTICLGLTPAELSLFRDGTQRRTKVQPQPAVPRPSPCPATSTAALVQKRARQGSRSVMPSNLRAVLACGTKQTPAARQRAAPARPRTGGRQWNSGVWTFDTSGSDANPRAWTPFIAAHALTEAGKPPAMVCRKSAIGARRETPGPRCPYVTSSGRWVTDWSLSSSLPELSRPADLLLRGDTCPVLTGSNARPGNPAIEYNPAAARPPG